MRRTLMCCLNRDAHFKVTRCSRVAIPILVEDIATSWLHSPLSKPR